MDAEKETITQEQEQQWIAQAKGGNREALERLVEQVRDPVFGLAVRMLYTPEDAQDATQEILIKVITHLAQFRGESRFTTWVYRIAANYLSGERKRSNVEHMISFEGFAEQFEAGKALERDPSYTGPEAVLLEEEMKLTCTGAMLMCLDRGHRLAFTLGRILDLPDKQVAAILEITESTYRKRLSRAHKRLSEFMNDRCGLVNPANPCRCNKRVEAAIHFGFVNPKQPLFANNRGRRNPTYQHFRQIGHLKRSVEVYRSHPEYMAPESMVGFVQNLISQKGFSMEV